MRGIWLMTLAACEGPGGGSGSGLVWVDAVGDEVPGVVSMWEGLAYVDGDDVFWRLDPFGYDAEAFSALGYTEGLRYSDAGCTEAFVLDPPPPRVAFYFDADDYRIVSDDAEAVELGTVYRTSGEDCESEGDTIYSAVSADDLTRVTRPDVTWTPPLHPELF